MEFRHDGHGTSQNLHYNRFNNSSKPRGRFNNHAHYNSPSDVQNHWCETCDRGFKTAFLLDKHLKEHMTCSIDGCKFVAHPKVITKHIEMQHSTGLYNKIGNLSNPEAIAKWREERKKKYPTKQNIERKQAELKEKLERGEKMGLKLHGKRFQEKGTNFKKDKHLHKQKFKRKPRYLKTEPSSKITQNIIECDLRRLKPFEGIQSIVSSGSEDESQSQMEEPSNIEDVDEVETTITASDPIVSNSNVCSALSSLITNYDSSDEELSTKNDKPSDKSTPILNQVTCTIKSNVLIPNDDDDDGPDEIKTNKAIPDLLQNEQSRNNSQTIRKSKHKVIPSHQRVFKRSNVPSSLLEKLLSKEIKHERNVALQCIRHIIKNNYFDVKELVS